MPYEMCYYYHNFKDEKIQVYKELVHDQRGSAKLKSQAQVVYFKAHDLQACATLFPYGHSRGDKLLDIFRCLYKPINLGGGMGFHSQITSLSDTLSAYYHSHPMKVDSENCQW